MNFQNYITSGQNYITSGLQYRVKDSTSPVMTTFPIQLYQSTAENNRVDKSSYLVSVGTLNGALRSECSIISPSIVIEQTTLPVFNYVYIEAFHRYYFVTGITSVNYKLWRINLSCDVLMSYKAGILNLDCLVARQENTYNQWINDPLYPLTNRYETYIKRLGNGGVLDTQTSDKHNFVLTVVGA